MGKIQNVVVCIEKCPKGREVGSLGVSDWDQDCKVKLARSRVSWVPTALVLLYAWLLTLHFELIATHWQSLGMGCLFPALPRSSLPAKKLEGLLRDIEGHDSEILLKTILGLYSMSSIPPTPDNSRPLFQSLCELFWACLFLLVI